jgi:hypothetical protein
VGPSRCCLEIAESLTARQVVQDGTCVGDRLAAPNALLRAGADQHWFVMNGGGVLIDGGCGLGAAVSILSLELQRAHPMVAVDALKYASVFNARVGVMSHVFYCSLLFEKSSGTLVTRPALSSG